MKHETVIPPVWFGKDALKNLGEFCTEQDYDRIFVLTDTNTRVHCLPVLTSGFPGIRESRILVMEAGEKAKNLETCRFLWQKLTEERVSRHSLLICLGGGVVSDTGGFVASVYKRGIPWIILPTSLLAMTDACIGGKTGIDEGGIKNLIGTFSHPEAVFIFPSFLDTLPDRQLRSGFAEMVKHALVTDRELWDELKMDGYRQAGKNVNFIGRSVKIKSDIVGRDFFERSTRKILNFGHTIGHALEAWSLSHDPDPLLHGEAVAAGMICEIFLSRKRSETNDPEYGRVIEFLTGIFGRYLFLPSDIPSIVALASHDKKSKAGTVRCSLLHGIGSCVFDQRVTSDELEEALEFYCHLPGKS